MFLNEEDSIYNVTYVIMKLSNSILYVHFMTPSLINTLHFSVSISNLRLICVPHYPLDGTISKTLTIDSVLFTHTTYSFEPEPYRHFHILLPV